MVDFGGQNFNWSESHNLANATIVHRFSGNWPPVSTTWGWKSELGFQQNLFLENGAQFGTCAAAMAFLCGKRVSFFHRGFHRFERVASSSQQGLGPVRLFLTQQC